MLFPACKNIVGLLNAWSSKVHITLQLAIGLDDVIGMCMLNVVIIAISADELYAAPIRCIPKNSVEETLHS